jgi:hypothetical protein
MAAGDLTTLANAKQWLGVSGTADDALLTRLITAVSGWIVGYLNRPILTATYTNTSNGNGGDTLLLPNTPITAVSSVSIDGVSIPAQTGPTTSGYTFDTSAIYLNGYSFTQAKANVQITYTAGFATVPLEIEQAAIELVEYRYTAKQHPHQKSVGIAQQTTSFITQDVPDYIKSMLSNYRRVAPL